MIGTMDWIFSAQLKLHDCKWLLAQSSVVVCTQAGVLRLLRRQQWVVKLKVKGCPQ